MKKQGGLSNKNDTIPTSVLIKCIKPKSIGELWCNEDTSVSTTGNNDEESLSSVDVSSEKNIYPDNKEDEGELTNDLLDKVCKKDSMNSLMIL